MFQDVLTDARESAPVMARMPARFDAVFDQLERGELVVRTKPVDPGPVGDPGLGYAVLAGAFVLAAAVLAMQSGPYAIASLVLALIFLVLYVRTRISRRGSQ